MTVGLVLETKVYFSIVGDEGRLNKQATLAGSRTRRFYRLIKLLSVHPAVVLFAAWDQMWQYQAEKQADTGNTATVHKPLQDNGTLFVI
ncbi:Uncharacterised protein [Yersinia intermedia]|jgi:hypothetical protein|nr:Uncharacterised protein [Yersinia intermedia]CQJ57879.1 Uncharacterised protein [Yersinia intermedia]CRE93674.1 Uncharacterised protein [Yersinia intermedia]